MATFLHRFVWTGITVGIVLCSLACPAKNPSEVKRERVVQNIHDMEEKLAALDEQVKASGSADPGKHAQAVQQQDLLKSRLERLKESIHYSESKKPE